MESDVVKSNYAKTTSTIHNRLVVLVYYNYAIVECKFRANGFYCLQISITPY